MCGKSTKTTDTTAHTVATPNVPDWLQQPTQGVASGIDNLLKMDPSTFVPGANANQTAAWNAAGGLTNPNAAFSGAADAVKQGLVPVTATTYNAAGYQPAEMSAATVGPMAHATSASVLDNLDAYKNPATHDLVDATLADFDQSAGQQRAADDLRAAQNGGLGQSGFAIQKALTAGEQARARTTADAQLRYDAFDKAAGLSAGDATRRQDASTFNAGQDNTGALAQAGYTQGANANNQTAKNSAWSQNATAANAAAAANATAANTVNQNNADRAVTAGSTLTNLGTAQGTDQRANLSTLDALGGDQRAVDTQQAQAPISVLSQIQSILQGIPISTFTGQTTDSTGHGKEVQTANTMDQLLKYIQASAQAAAAAGGA